MRTVVVLRWSCESKTMKDIDIRQILLSDLDQKYRSDPDTVIIEELGLCQGISRVDIAIVNGSIHGFEIKSDQDTLKRLPGQVEIYSRSLDEVTLVVGSKHLKEAMNLVPKWWGIITAKETEETTNLSMRRKRKPNPSPDPFAIVQLLWREEVFQALEERGLHRGLASKPRTVLWNKLAECLSFEELGSLVRFTLKSRGNWRSDFQQV